MSGTPAIVLGFPEYAAPARRLAARAGFDYADVAIHRFPDGESRLQLPPALPADVVLCRSLDDPNAKLVELELAAATALTLGAKRLTLVAPYLCYMRQDRAFHPGEAVSQHIVGRLLARHFDTLLTVDPHLHRTARLEDAVPVRQAITLSAAPVMVERLAGLPGRPLLIGPDAESAQWVGAIAAAAGLEHGVATKERLGDQQVRVELPDLAYAGRDVVLVDDVASTGRTLAEAARELRSRGAGQIGALVTHALFVGDALEALTAAGVGVIESTDSILHRTNALELAGLLAGALVRALNSGTDRCIDTNV